MKRINLDHFSHFSLSFSSISYSLSSAITRKQSKRFTNHSAANEDIGSSRWSKSRSSRKKENLIHEQALAAAILFQQQLQSGGAAPFDRSTSLRYPNGSSKKNQALPRRARSLTDPLFQPHQLVNQT
ncbi:hypothetical protein CASFOL_033819 [Castilleja foliolosa]|uniref:Uncharacterized protein n=1 Tax=Castilleja foliolosa TaxID=1961234 RepID=A0ABD3BY17_9LAMI